MLLINSTQAEASTGAFIEKYSHVVLHVAGMTKEGICLQCTLTLLIEDWPSMVMNQTTAQGGLDWIVPRVNNKYQDINLEYWDRLE